MRGRLLGFKDNVGINVKREVNFRGQSWDGGACGGGGVGCDDGGAHGAAGDAGGVQWLLGFQI